MKTSILDFLRTQTKKKLGRLLKKDEENKLYIIASMHEKDLREALQDEVSEFVALSQKCKKCSIREIETDGLCHICRLCEQNEIADTEEFARFYNNCATGDDNAKIKYYRSKIEQDGGF